MNAARGAQDMTGRSTPAPVPDQPPRPTQDELLDEALEETFPASDPVSVYRL